MIQKQVPIVFNHHLAGATHVLGFDCAEIARAAAPGQFVMMREVQPRGYLLNRPFSIGNVDGNTIEIYYDAVGKATHAFAELDKGDELDVFGPLGRGFTLETWAKVNVLVAGGIGIAPFPFLAIELAKRRPQTHTVVLAGFRSAPLVVLADLFAEIGVGFKVATDDGSQGYNGFVTGLLEQELDAHGNNKVGVYACGPELMLKRVAEIAVGRDVFCELSLEQRMACGVGACLVCACNTRAADGAADYKMVCKDGPVFNARDVVFE
ncbi:MAG: dihydroorotate dehydrogenase electron transfer subunit [Verrucomicrobia bacterium]|nr:dihydroorotate dehydrogenase electron transfer subunit [Verrucomicrobiota bacterium]